MSPHEKLFAAYVKELRLVKGEVDAWWSALLDAEAQRVGDRAQAQRELELRWPAGAAAHPRMIAVNRKYYLACNALNERLADEDEDEVDDSDDGDEDNDEGEREVEPVVFMSEWLLDGKNMDLVKFLGRLSYWPIGFDDEGDMA